MVGRSRSTLYRTAGEPACWRQAAAHVTRRPSPSASLPSPTAGWALGGGPGCTLTYVAPRPLMLPSLAAARGVGDGAAGRRLRGTAGVLAGHRVWLGDAGRGACARRVGGGGRSGVARGGVTFWPVASVAVRHGASCGCGGTAWMVEPREVVMEGGAVAQRRTRRPSQLLCHRRRGVCSQPAQTQPPGAGGGDWWAAGATVGGRREGARGCDYGPGTDGAPPRCVEELFLL